MTYVQWPESVNKKFYAYSKAPEDNYISTEYQSGRKTVILKNTRFVNKIKCSVTVSKTKSANELSYFWNWFTLSLGGLSGVFVCAELGEGYFRFSSTPSVTEAQKTARLDLEIEEVY